MDRPTNWRAIVMPAAPAPTMQRSVSSTVPVGICRRSMNMAVPVLAEGDERAEARFALRQHPAIDDSDVAAPEIRVDRVAQHLCSLSGRRCEGALEGRACPEDCVPVGFRSER